MDDPSVVFISHGGCEDEAKGLAESIQAKWFCMPFLQYLKIVFSFNLTLIFC